MEAFRPSVVRKLVEFLYTGDYSDSPDGDDGSELETPQTSENSVAADETQTAGCGLGSLHEHIGVHAIAVHYQADSLAALANGKIEALLERYRGEQALVDALPAAVERAMASSADRKLRGILAVAVAADMDALRETEKFAAFCAALDKSTFLFETLKAWKKMELKRPRAQYEEHARKFATTEEDWRIPQTIPRRPGRGGMALRSGRWWASEMKTASEEKQAVGEKKAAPAAKPAKVK